MSPPVPTARTATIHKRERDGDGNELSEKTVGIGVVVAEVVEVREVFGAVDDIREASRRATSHF